MFSSQLVSNITEFFLLPILFLGFLALVFGEYLLIYINILLTTLVLPLYLIRKYFQRITKYNDRFSLLDIPIMSIVVLLAIIINYSFWGLSSGLLFTPDGETVAITYFQTIIAGGILVVGSIVSWGYKLINK